MKDFLELIWVIFISFIVICLGIVGIISVCISKLKYLIGLFTLGFSWASGVGFLTSIGWSIVAFVGSWLGGAFLFIACMFIILVVAALVADNSSSEFDDMMNFINQKIDEEKAKRKS